MGLFDHLLMDKKKIKAKAKESILTKKEKERLWQIYKDDFKKRLELSRYFNFVNIHQALRDFDALDLQLEKIQLLIHKDIANIKEEEENEEKLFNELKYLAWGGHIGQINNAYNDTLTLSHKEIALIGILKKIPEILKLELRTLKKIRQLLRLIPAHVRVLLVYEIHIIMIIKSTFGVKIDKAEVLSIVKLMPEGMQKSIPVSVEYTTLKIEKVPEKIKQKMIGLSDDEIQLLMNLYNLLIGLFKLIFHKEDLIYTIFDASMYRNKEAYQRVEKLAREIILREELKEIIISDEDKFIDFMIRIMGNEESKHNYRKLAEEIYDELADLAGAPVLKGDITKAMDLLEKLMLRDNILYGIIKKLRPRFDDNKIQLTMKAFRKAYDLGYFNEFSSQFVT